MSISTISSHNHYDYYSFKSSVIMGQVIKTIHVHTHTCNVCWCVCVKPN